MPGIGRPSGSVPRVVPGGITGFPKPLRAPRLAQANDGTILEAGLWQEQPGQDASQAVLWFAPDASAEGFPPLVAAPAHPDFGWDAQTDRDQTVVWYQPDTGSEYVRVPPTAPFDPSTGFDWSEQPQAWNDGSPWYQPDTGAEYVRVPDAIVAVTGNFTGIPGTYLAQPGRFEPGKVPTAAASVVDNSTTAQRAALGLYDAQQDIDRTTVSFAPDASVEGFVPIAGAAFNPATGFGWQEAELVVSTDQQWFAPDVSVEGFPPRPAAPNHPDLGYDPQQDRDLSVTWLAPEPSVEGLVPLGPEPTHPDFGYDSQQDRDQTQVWFAPDSVDRPFPLVSAPVHPDFGYDPQTDRDQTVVWYQPDTGSEWVPVPNLGNAATVPQEPVGQPDPSEAIDQTVTWYQPDTGAEWVPIPGLTQATPAQDAALWQEQPGHERSLDVLWYQPEDPSEAYFPIIPSGSVASVAQQAALWPEQPAYWADPQTYAPEAAYEGFPPRVAAPTHPDFGYDPAQDRDQTETRFAPDASVEGFVPNLASAYTGFDLTDLSGQDVVATVPAVWVEPPAEGLLPPVVAAPVAPFAPLWIEQPGQETSQAVIWFAPDIAADGFVPLASAPTHPGFGWDAQQDIDRTTVWFAPDASVEGYPPRVSAYTGFDIGWDAAFDRDQTVVWYAPDELFWCPTPPFAPSVATVPQQPIQQPDWSESRDQTVIWFAPDAAVLPSLVVPFVGGPGPSGTSTAITPAGSGTSETPSGTGTAATPSGSGMSATPSGTSTSVRPS